jgi:1-acyl-sn-glycerol-3-phosphate acyltransferase
MGAKILCKVFFRNVYVSGSPYLGKGAIWCSNHSSGIVDPMVVFGVVPVPLRPISKSTLWNHPVMRPLLQLAKAIPVFRVQDMKQDLQAHKEAQSKGEQPSVSPAVSNSEAFRAVTMSLLKGDRILIFPEGISHDQPYLNKLKTGFARMGLQAMAQATESNFAVVIQPIAIDYFEKDEFRSDLALHYCEPIAVTSPDIEVEDLVNAVRESLLRGLATFSNWDEKRNWHFLFEIAYGRPPYSAREFQKFVSKNFTRMTADQVFMARVQTMRRMLLVSNLSPRIMLWGESHEKKRTFFKLILGLGWLHFFVALPTRYLSLLFWYLPTQMCGILANLSTKERDVVATMKIAHGIYLFPLWNFGMGMALSYLAMPFWENTFCQGFFIFGWLGVFLLFFDIMMEGHFLFFTGVLTLAKLRLFSPRRWLEAMKEWRDISNACMEKITLPGKG